jgi:hypothetical protein
MDVLYYKFDFAKPAILKRPVLLRKAGQDHKAVLSIIYQTSARELSGQYILSPGFTLKAS